MRTTLILRALAAVTVCFSVACSTLPEHPAPASVASASSSAYQYTYTLAESTSAVNSSPVYRKGHTPGANLNQYNFLDINADQPLLSPHGFSFAATYTGLSNAFTLAGKGAAYDQQPALAGNTAAAFSEPAVTNKAMPGLVKIAAKDTVHYEDIWARIVAGMQFSQALANNRIQREVDLYSSYPADLERTFKRSEPFLHFIVEAAAKRGIPLELALLPVVESAFNPFAYSPVQAAGIWQFIPGTGKYFGLQQSPWYDGRRDVTASTHAAFDYLQTLANRFDGDWLLALAAYNSGAGTVSRAINRNRKNNKPIDYWHLELPNETKKYVPRLIAIAKIVADPEHYGITLHPIANKPVFKVAELNSQIDLTRAALLAGMTVDDLYAYNPGFKQWATDPQGPHRLVIPTDNIEQFNTNLAKLPKAERMRWFKYRVRKGDNLTAIAKRFNTSVPALQAANGIENSLIRVGKLLQIPNVPDHQLAGIKPTTSINTAPVNSHKVFYKVKKGDTLWDISREFHVSIRKLANWNKIAPSDILRPGRTLVLWAKPYQTTYLASATNSNSNSRSQNLRKIDYQVEKGDSLYGIANKFKVTVIDLLQWNDINARAFLQPGQLLNVFVGH